MRVIAALLFLSICLNGRTQGNLSMKEKMDDIDYLKNALLFAHPSTGRYTPKDTIISQLDELKRSVDSDAQSAAFRLEIARIVSQMKCVHTSVLRGNQGSRKSIRKMGPPSIMPVQFFYDGTDLWVAKSYFDSLKMIEGMRVDSLDRRSVSEIMDRIMGFRSGDGYSPVFMQTMINWKVNFSSLYKAYYQPDSIVTAVLSKNSERRIVRIPFAQTKIPATGKPSQDLIFSTPNHRFWMDSISGAGVLRIAAFNPQKKVNRFYRNIFNYLSEHEIKNLIIDMRWNTGGNIHEAEKLLSYTVDTTVFFTLERSKSALGRYTTFMSNYLAFMNFMKRKVISFARRYRQGELFILEQKTKPQKKNRFTGNVYVIQNGFTASSGSFVSTYLKEHVQAIIVGTESGGGAAGNNGLFYATSKLPNSKIKVRMPQYWLNYHLIPDKGRGVLPDIPVRYSIDDIMRKKDLEMVEIRKLIRQRS